MCKLPTKYPGHVGLFKNQLYTGRNETFLQHSTNYSRKIMGGIAINLFPDFLKPLFGLLLARKGTKECEASIDVLLPLVRERIEAYRTGSAGPVSHLS